MLLVGVGFATAVPLTSGPLVQVSGASPIAACDGDDGNIGGTNFVNSEVEPWLSVDPSNADVMMGAWQQDRWSNGGSDGLVTATSMTGGASWTVNSDAKSTTCAGGTPAIGGNYERASDPWVAISPNGTAYLMSRVDSNPGGFDTSPNAMLVMRSTDHGESWEDPVTLIRDESRNFLNDKNSSTGNQSPYVLRSQPGVVTTSILTVGDSVNTKPDGVTPYRLVGIPDGLGAFDNGNGTFTVLMNHELGSTAGVVRAHGARGAFVSKWTIRTDDLAVLHGEDLIQTLHTWNPTLGGGAGDWEVSNSDAAPARLNRLCSADLAPVSAFYNAASGNGYNGRIFTDGEEGGTSGRPFGHVVATGDSFELTPWLGNMSFENVVAHPGTGDATVSVGLDDGDATVGQQVYVHLGTKTDTGNPVQRAGLANGTLYGVKVAGIPQSEYQKTDWRVGDEFDFELVATSRFAGVGGTTDNGAVDTLEEDSQANGVTNFQRPEDGAWDPRHPSDFYFVTTSSFGPLAAENRTGETRLWRLRFADPTDPSEGGKLTLLVSGPVGTADSPSATGTQSAGSPGPQMFDNITVNSRGQVLLNEDVGNQAYLGRVWLYDIASGALVEVARHDPQRFTPGVSGFLTKDEESSGIIPAPFLGAGWYLTDVQAHYPISGELVQGGQLLALQIPPGKFRK